MRRRAGGPRPTTTPSAPGSGSAAYHRMLATYLNALTDAGLVLERAHESSDAVPLYLVLACRRAP